MKKTLATCLLILFCSGYFIEPAGAILEHKKQQEVSVLDNINYDWWKQINDSCLEGYIQKAIDKNHDIKTAQLSIEQANLNVWSARANQLPSVSFGASPFVAKIPGQLNTFGTFALPINASYELDIFGKNSNKTKSKKYLYESTKYQSAASEIAIASAVGTVYYNIVILDKAISIQEELVKERKQIYELMKMSNFEGLVSTQDLIASEKSYVLAQNDLLEFKKNRQIALDALAVLTGDSADNTSEFKRISYDKLSSNFKIPKSIESDIIVNRPDYKSLEQQIKSAGMDIRACKKEFLPTFDILGIMTFVASSSLEGMSWANTFALAGGQATLPIFTGFSRLTNLRLAQNKYKQLIEKYQQTNLTAIQEVNDSLYSFRSDDEKHKNNVKALQIQTKDYNLSKNKFNQGTISKLDLLQQQETLLYIKQLEVSSKIDCYIDKISLYKATGAKI